MAIITNQTYPTPITTKMSFFFNSTKMSIFFDSSDFNIILPLATIAKSQFWLEIFTQMCSSNMLWTWYKNA